MAESAKNTRNIGIDLLRALAMLFVICQHILGQGGVLEHSRDGSGRFWLLSFSQILVYCAVNIYGLTTGYLLCQKKFRLARAAKLWLTTAFWSVAVSCCFFALDHQTRTVKEAVSMFFPLLRGRYWFFTAYFVVMLLSPALNLLIRSMTRRQFHLLFAALFVIFGIVPIGSLGYDVLRIQTGHHFAWMAVLYLIGGYLRLYGDSLPQPKRKSLWLAGFSLLAGIQLVYKLAVNAVGLTPFSNLLLTYPSPLILGQAVCLFLGCKDCFRGAADGFAGRLMGFIAPGIYAVYLIHVHPLVFWNERITALFRSWDGFGPMQTLAALVLTALAVFAACILLDTLRQWLFRLLRINRAVEKLSDCAEYRIRSRIR